MEEIIHVPEEQSETGNLTEYTESVVECFDSVPEVAKPLIGSAGRLLNRIEKMLYSAPAFVGAVVVYVLSSTSAFLYSTFTSPNFAA